MSYEFNLETKDFYESELCNKCTTDIEEQINIRSVALDLLKNFNAYRQSGNDIHKEYLFSIPELIEFFCVKVDKQDDFVSLLERAHKYFQKNKERTASFQDLSYSIAGTIYYRVHNLLKMWPLVDQMVAMSIYYTYRAKRV